MTKLLLGTSYWAPIDPPGGGIFFPPAVQTPSPEEPKQSFFKQVLGWFGMVWGGLGWFGMVWGGLGLTWSGLDVV